MKASSEKSASKSSSAKKPAPDKGASKKPVSGKAEPDKAPAEKVASKKAASDKASPSKAPALKAAPDKAAAPKATSDKAAAEKAAAAKAASDKAGAKVASDRAAAEQAKAASDKAAAEQAKAASDKAAAEQAKAASDKAAAAKAAAAAPDTPATDNAAPQSASHSAGEDANVEAHLLEPHESFPNNPQLPVLLYRAAFRLPGYGDAAGTIEKAFRRNGWSSGWRDGLYNYHHYHSTAHEVLGCYAGKSRVQIGGPQGPVLDFARGDVLVLPAGAAHKSIETSKDFSVVGSYAQGRSYDMRRGRPEELAQANEQIEAVPLPERDPVFGSGGPLFRHWPAASRN